MYLKNEWKHPFSRIGMELSSFSASMEPVMDMLFSSSAKIDSSLLAPLTGPLKIHA